MSTFAEMPDALGMVAPPGLPRPGPGRGAGAPDPPPGHNLPLPRTAFVGRQQERWQVETLLDRSRLVTLIGPGGMGKTSLAVQVAAALLPEFLDGVRFVALAEIRNPELIPAQIIQALG